MDFTTYAALAKRTEKELDSNDKVFAHHLMGLTTEFGEAIDALKKHYIYGKPFNKVNFVEEIGDACWYLAGMFNLLKIPDLGDVPELDISTEWEVAVVQLMDAHGKQAEALLEAFLYGPEALSGLYGLYESMLNRWCPGVTIEQAFEINIKKLQLRYPEKYLDGNAIDRDTAAELALLKEAIQ